MGNRPGLIWALEDPYLGRFFREGENTWFNYNIQIPFAFSSSPTHFNPSTILRDAH
jgi:hypothetical protein